MWKCVFLSAAASATSSPAMLGIKEHRDSVRDYQRVQSTMQFYNYQGDNNIHKNQYPGTEQFMHWEALCALSKNSNKAYPLSSPDCRLPSSPFCAIRYLFYPSKRSKQIPLPLSSPCQDSPLLLSAPKPANPDTASQLISQYLRAGSILTTVWTDQPVVNRLYSDAVVNGHKLRCADRGSEWAHRHTRDRQDLSAACAGWQKQGEGNVNKPSRSLSSPSIT